MAVPADIALIAVARRQNPVDAFAKILRTGHHADADCVRVVDTDELATVLARLQPAMILHFADECDASAADISALRDRLAPGVPVLTVHSNLTEVVEKLLQAERTVAELTAGLHQEVSLADPQQLQSVLDRKLRPATSTAKSEVAADPIRRYARQLWGLMDRLPDPRARSRKGRDDSPADECLRDPATPTPHSPPRASAPVPPAPDAPPARGFARPTADSALPPEPEPAPRPDGGIAGNGVDPAGMRPAVPPPAPAAAPAPFPAAASPRADDLSQEEKSVVAEPDWDEILALGGDLEEPVAEPASPAAAAPPSAEPDWDELFATDQGTPNPPSESRIPPDLAPEPQHFSSDAQDTAPDLQHLSLDAHQPMPKLQNLAPEQQELPPVLPEPKDPWPAAAKTAGPPADAHARATDALPVEEESEPVAGTESRNHEIERAETDHVDTRTDAPQTDEAESGRESQARDGGDTDTPPVDDASADAQTKATEAAADAASAAAKSGLSLSWPFSTGRYRRKAASPRDDGNSSLARRDTSQGSFGGSPRDITGPRADSPPGRNAEVSSPVSATFGHSAVQAEIQLEAPAMPQEEPPHDSLDESAESSVQPPMDAAQPRAAADIIAFDPALRLQRGESTSSAAGRSAGRAALHQDTQGAGAGFLAKLEQRLQSASPDGVRVLVWIQIDRFAELREELGFVASERLLEQVETLIRGELTSKDLLGRIAGYAFAVLLKRPDLPACRTWCSDLLQRVGKQVFEPGNRSLAVTCSAGLGQSGAYAPTLDALLDVAEKSCRSARNDGGNRLNVPDAFAKDARSQEHSRLWARHLQAALATNRFKLVKQPIVPLHEQEQGMYDLWIRMVTRSGQKILPAAFLPAAKQHRLMPQIDRWVIRGALNSVRVQDSARAFVRVSAETLQDTSLLPWIEKELRSTGAEPGRLCIQITEEVCSGQLKRAQTFAQELRGLGCRFAVEHFGTGRNPLQLLQLVPMDYVKIDGALIQALPAGGAEQRRLVQEIVQAARAQQILTIAERVENTGIMPQLFQLGVSFMQGYSVQEPEKVQVDG